jgi:hypothetical protein
MTSERRPRPLVPSLSPRFGDIAVRTAVRGRRQPHQVPAAGGTNASADLTPLLATLDPTLSEMDMVFCSLPGASMEQTRSLSPIAYFVEAEGISLIIDKAIAEQHGLRFATTFRAITLNVHSDLEAVGLTAAVAGRLALHGISANVVAAYHHDHIFVPTRDAERALQALRTLQAESATAHGHTTDV